MQVQTQWVNTTDQQRLFVKLWGNEANPALVLVHGYPDNQEVWEPVIQHLIHDFYVIAMMCVAQGNLPCLETFEIIVWSNYHLIWIASLTLY